MILLRLPWRAGKTKNGQELFGLLRDAAAEIAESGDKAKRGYALEVAVTADQWLAPNDPDERLVFVNPVLRGGDEGRATVEWDVVRLDLFSDGDWTLTAIECSTSPSPAKKDADREKLEELRKALAERFADLAQYRTLFATVDGKAVAYEDAARGFSRDA